MSNKLDKIFEIVSFYDEARWSQTENYSLINFCEDGLDADTKLLTHWLCYITDRQMPFERIWDVGGFVLSELVSEYKKKTPINKLLSPAEENSFVIMEFDKKEKKYKHLFIGTKSPNKRIEENYPAEAKNFHVKFKPRFLPSDYLCIFYTLYTLEKFDYSISSYIAKAYYTFKGDKFLIQKILFSLYLLSYRKIGQPKDEDIEQWKENLGKADKRRDEICKYFEHPEIKDDEFTEFQNNTRYNLKRAWCSLRDFLKSSEFKSYFKEAMKFHGINAEELFEESILHQLELPGDVWNNNSKFRKCILAGTMYENVDNKKLSVILREYFDSQKNKQGYPEQFDITFDFVPKMCDSANCDICPIGRLSDEKNKGQDFENTCVKNKDMYCPVALVGCGYKKMCVGREKCELLKILK